MNITNLMKVAITAILSNKSRTLLSTLGIIIGVAAVIAMMAIGEGSKKSIRTELSKMGTNLIFIRPGADTRGGVKQDAGAMQTLKPEDYQAILARCPLVKYASPEVSAAGQVIRGGKNTYSTIYGEMPEFMDIRLWEIRDGDCFTDDDVRRNAKVCMVGTTVVEELFGDKDYNAVGQYIRFRSIPFQIIGVLKSKGSNSWGMDQDNLIVAPYTTVMKRISAQDYLNCIMASARSEEESQDAIAQVTAVLRETHKLPEGTEDNFTIHSQEEMMSTMDSTLTTVQTVLVVAAAFSLLVAGIGIMNIMLVSVTERTKEIGLRMSVGARGRDISRQFLLESVMISLCGGLIGVLLGYGMSWAAQSMGFPAVVPLWSVVVSFGVCAFIGLVFGYIPARKAARLDPIEAIRYE